MPLRERSTSHRGVANRRMRELAAAALERAPELPEWIEATCRARKAPPPPAGLAVKRSPSPCRPQLIPPAPLAYDEIFATSWR